MAKYKDIGGMGKSTLCPKRKDESPKERHARRKSYNLRQKNQLESFCKANGITLHISNEGHHWRAIKDKMIIEWWPSSAKVVINKHWKRGIHCHDVSQFQELLQKKLVK